MSAFNTGDHTLVCRQRESQWLSMDTLNCVEVYLERLKTMKLNAREHHHEDKESRATPDFGSLN